MDEPFQYESTAVNQIFEFEGSLEKKLEDIRSETDTLFEDTIIGKSTALIREKTEPKLINKPKKRNVYIHII